MNPPQARRTGDPGGEKRAHGRPFYRSVSDFAGNPPATRVNLTPVRVIFAWGETAMPDRNLTSCDEPFNLDNVRDELGRVPVVGPESDRELFLDLPLGGVGTPQTGAARQSSEREFLANDFGHGI